MAKKSEEVQSDTNVSEQAATVISGMTMEMLVAAITAAVSGQKTDPAMMAIAESLKSQADVDAQRFRKENKAWNETSVFTYDEGEAVRKKPRLDSVTIFANAKQSEDQLMPIEVELFNKIKSNKSARKGKWQAIYEPPIGDAKQGRLMISLGADVNNPDQIIGIPPLVQILTELATGADATNVAVLFQQLADLESKVKAYEQQKSAGVPDVVLA